ncbi:MAG: hypothetical protein P1U65_02900 [Minwuia sp.]|nr:hypothetical protein [Minwuia sp.]
MALNSVQLCARALLKIGAQPITSFEENTAEAEISSLLYDICRDALLSAHPWSFASAQDRLARLDEAPQADFDHAFALPSDFLRVLSAGHGASGRGRGISYRIQEQRLHTNAESLMLTYIFRPDESAFPAFFNQALICRLAAEFCLPLTENTSRTDMFNKAAEIEFARARGIDAQQQTPQTIERFPLVDVRG